MFDARKGQITITRGDTGLLAIVPTGYVPTSQDRMFFMVAEMPDGRIVINKTVTPDDDGVCKLMFSGTDTENLSKRHRAYTYAIRFALDVTESNGKITGYREMITPEPPGCFVVLEANGCPACTCETKNVGSMEVKLESFRGPKGDRGETGPIGPQGPKGEKGDKGDKGDKGEKGDTGPQGETGAKGDKGDKGDTGAKGEPGKDAVIDVTLTQGGAAADAKAAGKAISQLKEETDALYGKFYDLSNLADPSKFVVGIIDSNNNIFPEATKYVTNDYIFVKAGETIASNYELKRAIALNADKNTKVWYSENVTEYTAEVDSWFRASLYAKDSCEPHKTSWMLNYGTESLAFVPYHKEIIYAEARKKIVISVKDGIQSFYDKMLDAYNTTNCDVYVENGTYIYTNELIDAIRASGKRGIPIGNGCHYYFESGAFIYCEYTGENKSDVCNMFSPLDSQSVGTDFEIENLHIVSKNTVYALHDESNGATNHVRHRYKNCYIELDNSAIPDIVTYISKALGGGLGQYTDICIENCVFIGTNPYNPNSVGNDASYHGPINSDVSHNRITVVNSWFKGNFRTSNLGTETDVKCDLTYSGCSSSSPVSFPDNWNAKVFCNEIRS